MKAAACCIAFIAAFAAASLHSQDTAPDAPTPKVIGVYEVSDKEVMWALENPSFGPFLGVECVSGTCLGVHALKDKVMHFPVDKVAIMIEFDSFDEVKAYIEEE